MSLTDVVADQLARPSGLLAPFAAQTLNRRNGRLIERTITALDVQPCQRILDVGFGGGLSLRLLRAQAAEGQVSGIDASPAMVARSARILRPAMLAGQVTVGVGRAEAIPFDDGSFDRVLTCQTTYFWKDVGAGLAEVHRVLVPGGRFAVAMMPKPLQEQLRFVERGYQVLSHAELAAGLEDAGFEGVAPWPANSDHRPRWILVGNKARGRAATR